jgi:hypothetical protein
MKLRNGALTLIGEMHSQIGPMVKALIVANNEIEQSVKDQTDKKIASCPMDPNASSVEREKSCLVLGHGSNNIDGTATGESDGNGMGFEIPKTDLVASLPSDCMTRMGLKETKDSWKKRKEALEEVESACAQYNGLISSSPDAFKGLVDLMRALKSRLGDSQSNLKPFAARNIAAILASVDVIAQAKLGKIVYRPLISAAMNDNKKIMRDASLEALKKGTMKLEMEGGGMNTFSMEPLMQACSVELNEKVRLVLYFIDICLKNSYILHTNTRFSKKASGLPSVLAIVCERIPYFPKVNAGNKSKAKAKTQEEEFAKAILKCLTSSKSESRSLAEDILKECITNRVLNISSVEKAASRMSNSEQRKVRPILDRLGSMAIENMPSEPSPPRKAAARPASTIPFRNSGRESPARSKSTVPFQHSPARPKTGSQKTGRSRERNSLDHRKRSMSRNRRESASGSKQGSEHSGAFSDLMNDPAFHPLKSETAITMSKDHRISRQREHLPEYPEGPSGKDTLSDLKRSWAPLLPHSSVQILFPSSGIRVQDDASTGCELLSRGVEMVIESGEENVVINQIDLIIRWYAYVLYSRETTKGMQFLISFLLKLVTLLRNQQYEFTDSESIMLLPILLEKAGAAKVRKFPKHD